MKIEKQVASLEDAKKFQELGIDFGETVWVWLHFDETKVSSFLKEEPHWKLVNRNGYDLPQFKEFAPAPTDTEMLDWLPKEVVGKNKITHYFLMKKDVCIINNEVHKSYVMGYYYDEILGKGTVELEEKELKDALPKLCIWVNKEGYK